MTAVPPLLALMLGNFSDAIELGLVDDSSGQVSAFSAEVRKGWIWAGDPLKQLSHFELTMTAARSRLDALHRPLRSVRQRVQTISTVMTFARFANRFEDEIAAPKASAALKSLLDEPAVAATGLAEAERACLEFTARFGAASAGPGGRRVRASGVGIGAGRHTWTAPPPAKRATRSAQYWRDRLGLIHVVDKASPEVGHALVRVEFVVEPTKEPLNRKDWKGSLGRSPKGIWIIRPTMVHEGNRRFVQSHNADAGRRVRGCQYGMTRDLDSKTFDAVEPETLLVCGSDAEIRFSSVALLLGLSGEVSGRNNSDESFVGQIASERGWVTT